ncbi:MAG: hypothetical protein ACRD4A_04400 [Candidatus Acidiferrales bacterium]
MIEGKGTGMTFIALEEELALAIWADSVNLSFVASGDKERADGVKGEGPNVFRFGIEEDGVLAVGRDFIDFPIRRRCDVDVVLLIDREGLSCKLG